MRRCEEIGIGSEELLTIVPILVTIFLSKNEDGRNLFKKPAVIDAGILRRYLKRFQMSSANTYANVLKTLRVFFRDYLDREDVITSFKFPRRPYHFKVIPRRKALQTFYGARELPRDRALFLLFATCGWRKHEVLRLTYDRIDFNRRMLTPEQNSNRTKGQWFSFYNEEAEDALTVYASQEKGTKIVFKLNERSKLKTWVKAEQKCGVHIRPQMLREWFCSELEAAGYVNVEKEFVVKKPHTVLHLTKKGRTAFHLYRQSMTRMFEDVSSE
jgi:integrase